MSNGFLWVKAFHIVFVASWFAGLFYLPRLFVYHSMTDDESGSERFKLMERKLYWGIMAPGAALTLASGLWLWLGWFRDAGGWLYAKLALVALLVAYHLWCGKLLADFKLGRNAKSHTWLRWFNEFPVLILFGAVVLVVLKPF